MRYAFIDEYEVVNGENNGMSLFVQGCHFHCKNCFNSDIWDFEGGKEWTNSIKKSFINSLNRTYIKRLTILGGEPLADENIPDVFKFVFEVKTLYPDKEIWIYTGYLFDDINSCDIRHDTDFFRRKILKYCDVLVDGRYVDELRDITLKWKGSSNQRVIDVQQSIKQNKVVIRE